MDLESEESREDLRNILMSLLMAGLVVCSVGPLAQSIPR